MPGARRAASASRSDILPLRVNSGQRESGRAEPVAGATVPEMVVHPRRAVRIASLGRTEIEKLRTGPAVSLTPHFALHHASVQDVATELSTDDAPRRNRSVNNKPPAVLKAVGIVVPKRLARRAVTRNLIRRQARDAVRRSPLALGHWLVRLRRAFDARGFPSAASPMLKLLVRAELDELVHRACEVARP